MTEPEPNSDKEQEDGANSPARRNLLVGSGALLVGGLTGRATSPQAATSTRRSDGPQSVAPPLPWKWPKIDPMEAGTRTYHAYLQQRG